MFLLASMAFLGPFRAVDDVTVHRATGGLTRSLRHVARSAGFSRFEAAAPQLALVGSVLRDVGWHNPVYRPLGPPGRLWLAARCAGTFFWRFVVLNVPELFRRIVGRGRDRPHRVTPSPRAPA